MNDYIVFTINENHYALEVSKIERIDQVPELTPLPNAHPCIDGMMMYQNQTAKVVNFRRVTNIRTHEEEMKGLFLQVIQDHKTWVETLYHSLESGEPFKLALDPHLCRLGKWLYGYTTHDPDVLSILRALMPIHARLHETGAELLGLCGSNPSEAMRRYHDEIVSEILVGTMHELNLLVEKSSEISSHAQKMLIYRTDKGFFAIKVDSIRDITSFDDKQIKPYAHEVKVGSFLQTRGVVEYKEKLVIIIDSVELPHDEAA